MAVNINKTKFISFQTKLEHILKTISLAKISQHLKYNYNNNHLNKDKEAYKLLSIYFDEHRSFGNHTDKLTCQLNKSLFCTDQAKTFQKINLLLLSITLLYNLASLPVQS
jgi:hypothetical protein